MNTELALAGAGHGGLVARRAMLRWAWRLLRREWRQQILMVVLLAAAVALVIVGSGIAVNTPSDSTAATFGTAGKIITIPGSDQNLAAELAFLRRGYGTIDVIEDQDLATGTTQPIVLRAQDPQGRYGQPMLALESGHYPDGPGQVAVTGGVASLFGLRTGGTWHENGRVWRVTGVVEDPANLLDQFALVAPGQVTHPTLVRILLTATDNGHGFGSYPGQTLQYRPSESGSLNGLPNRATDILGVAVLGLVFTGLAALAGFTVMAQRRRRALGMLAAVGATARDLKLVMLASGAAVGVSGVLAGAVAGLAAWAGYAPRLQAITEHRVRWTDLPWWVIGTVLPLTVLTAVAAAWWPARAVARTPVVQALSGRPPRRSRPGRLVVRGAVTLAAGVCFLAVTGTGTGGVVAGLLLATGLAAIMTGALLLTPFAIAWPASLVRNGPAAVVLAVRGLGRYRAHYGAALAAVTVAVLLAALTCLLAVAASTSTSPLVDTGPDNLAANELVIWTPDSPVAGNADAISLSSPGTATPVPLVPSAAELTALAAKAAALAASIHAQFVLPLESAQARSIGPVDSAGIPGAILWQAGQPLARPATGGGAKGPGGDRFAHEYGTLYVATSALLHDFGINPNPDADVLTTRSRLPGLHGLELFNPVQAEAVGGPPCAASYCVAAPVVQTASGLPSGTDAPNTVITEHAVQALGLRTITDGWLIQTVQPLTAAQISAARQLAIANGTDIETQTPPPPDPATLKNVVTAAGLVAALCVTALTAALVRAETARDLRTLTAAGATSRHRRALAAATAATLGLLGAVLGTALAYLTVTAWAHDRLAAALNPVPAADLVVLLAGLPFAAALASWLLAGREPRNIARRPLD